MVGWAVEDKVLNGFRALLADGADWWGGFSDTKQVFGEGGMTGSKLGDNAGGFSG